jgi:hypothetical protein
VDRFLRTLAFVPFSIQREIDHHDRIFLNDADQQNDSDQRNKREINSEE